MFYCFPDLLFNSFCCFSFPTFHYEHGTFFYAKFHSYIRAVFSYCLYKGIQFFTVLSAQTITDITVILIFHNIFNTLAMSINLFIFSLSLTFTLRWQVLFFLVWSSARDWTIPLFLKVLGNFMRLILWDEFWFVHIYISLVCRVFANSQGDLGSIPRRVMPKTLKWYLIHFA